MTILMRFQGVARRQKDRKTEPLDAPERHPAGHHRLAEMSTFCPVTRHPYLKDRVTKDVATATGVFGT